MKIKAVYVRVSHEEQVEGHSLHLQEQVCREFAAAQKLDNVIVYRDEGYSATSTRRPAIRKLLVDLRNGLIDTLIIAELDRLSRNVMDGEEIIQIILNKNIKFYTVLDNIKIENADDRLIFRFKLSIGQHGSEKISEKSINGIKGGFDKGLFSLSTAPIGYKKSVVKAHLRPEERKNAVVTLIPIEEELKLIKNIFEWYVRDNLTIKDIELKLKDTDYNFKQNKISKILSNDIYTGIKNYRGKSYKLIGLKKIISEETFFLAKEKIVVRRKEIKYEYYFRNKLVCSKCNCVLAPVSTIKPKKVYLYYQCPICKKRINQELVIKKYTKEINSMINKKLGIIINKKNKVTYLEIASDKLKFLISEHFSEKKIKL